MKRKFLRILRARPRGTGAAFLALLAVVLASAVWTGIRTFRDSGNGKKTAAVRAENFSPGQAVPGRTGEAEKNSSNVFRLRDESTGKNYRLTAEEFLPAAVACEMDPSSPAEALKAQAVACCTYYSRKRDAGETIFCNAEDWQIWTTEEHMQERWGRDWDVFRKNLEDAVQAVKGQLLTSGGRPILASYFAISAGNTETCANVWEEDLPYLQAVASPGDQFSDGYLSVVTMSGEEFRRAAEQLLSPEGAVFPPSAGEWLTDLEYTASGYVRSGNLCGTVFSGSRLRNAFGLRSAAFRVTYDRNEVTFTVRGWGHGVGMSQSGAVFLAGQGAGYREILSHYYPGAVLTCTI